MTSVLFSGVFDSDTGPAIVNRAYASGCREWLTADAPRPRLAAVFRLIRHHRRFSGVLVSSTSGHHALLMLTARLLRKNAFYLAHGVGRVERRINSTPSLKASVFEWLTVRLSSSVVAVSTRLAQQLVTELAVPPAKVRVVFNGTDLLGDESLPPVPAPEAGRIRIMTVGTRPIKNVETLFRALEVADLGDVELVVVGAVPEGVVVPPSRLTVIQHASLPHAATMSWMRSSHIYVQLSLVEPFGLAVCEAAQADCVLLLSAQVGAAPTLVGLTADNLVESPLDEAHVARQLEVLVAKFRGGAARSQQCRRTWQEASDDLAAAIRA
jgi:glycosyltransferase involved in cell wall biosynthesis